MSRATPCAAISSQADQHVGDPIRVAALERLHHRDLLRRAAVGDEAEARLRVCDLARDEVAQVGEHGPGPHDVEDEAVLGDPGRGAGSGRHRRTVPEVAR